MLFQTPELDDQELAVLVSIGEFKKQLRHVVEQPLRRWQGLLRRNTLARAIRGSNTIEGYDVTIDDAVALVEGEEPFEASAQNAAAVTGYRRAMTYVLQLADAPYFAYSVDLLRSLHFMMMEHDLSKWPGKWRPGAVFVRDEERGNVVYEGPEFEQVPELMDELVVALNNDGEAATGMIRAAMAHLNFVMIHPFKDGNGRMARCLQTMVLARAGTLAAPFSSIEEWLGRNTREYYDVLAQVGAGSWHPERNCRRWIRFCLKAHFQQASRLLQRTRDIERLWEAIETEVRRLRLPDRAVLAVVDAALGSKVRNATYRTVADVSDQVASRDLKMLVDVGLLVAHGERRGRYYKASERIELLRQQTKEARTWRDPFIGDAGQLTLPTVG